MRARTGSASRPRAVHFTRKPNGANKNLEKGFNVVVACSAEAKPRAEKLLKEAGLLDNVTVLDMTELLNKPVNLAEGGKRS